MAKLTRAVTVAAMTAALLSACHRTNRSDTAAPNPAIVAAVDAKTPPQFVGHDRRGRELWDEERRFYKNRGARLAWSDDAEAGPRAAALMRAVDRASDEGLDPGDYRLKTEVLSRFDRSRAADFDLQLTYAYLSYAADLAFGATRPEDIDPEWHGTRRDVDVVAALERGIDENRIEDSLAKLAPAAPQYGGLKEQLRRYRGMAEGGETDGGGVAAARRVQQIAMNMDRWRWLPTNLGDRYLIVNIPAFRLDAIENARSVLAMKVVVGKKDNPTPVLADEMTSVVFSPYWNIPPDIVEKETLPHVLKDAAYLEKNDIEVVRGSGDPTPVDPRSVDWNDKDAAAKVRFRQKPGAGNSLGLVKFIFPNHFNVYLHDTPAQALFNRIERDFSHGCVRVERPMDLAKYVLRDQPSWTEDKIDEAMHAGTERSVALNQPLPVYLVYFTAWEDNGSTQFVDDVYGYDRRQGARN
jgi:murein L,D-transpeptidase YcbB/YkuD